MSVVGPIGRSFLSTALFLALAGLPGLGWTAGPFGGTVEAVALAADGRTPALAATDRGLFRHDGTAWERIQALGQRDLTAVVEAGDRLLAVERRRGLLASDDEGRRWEPSDKGLVGRYGRRVEDVLSLAASPEDPSHLYLGAAGHGPFESRDGGRSWALLLRGLEDAPPPAFFPTALLPESGGRPTLMGTDGRGLYALDAGEWGPVGQGLPEGLRVQALAASPADPRHLALATRGEGLWESRDGGQTWKLLRKGAFGIVGAVSVGGDGAVLAHFPEEGLTVARGGKVTPVPELVGAQVRALAARRGGGWVAGLAHDGLLSLSPEGAVEGGMNQGLDATMVRCLAEDAAAGEIWAGDANGVFFSADGGGSWEARDQGLLGAPATALVWAGGRLYLGTGGQGVFRWDPAARSWEARSGGLGTSNTIFSLVADTSGEKLYAGTEGGVFATADGGGLWTPRSSGLPPASVWVATSSPVRSGVLWASGAGRLFRSADGGDSWEPVGAASAVALVPGLDEGGPDGVWVLEANRVLFAEDGGGVKAMLEGEGNERFHCLVPAESGATWVGASRGLWRLDPGRARRAWEEAGVLSLQVLGEDHLRAGTDGRGVVRLPLD